MIRELSYVLCQDVNAEWFFLGQPMDLGLVRIFALGVHLGLTSTLVVLMSKPLQVLIEEIVEEYGHKADLKEFERLAAKLRERIFGPKPTLEEKLDGNKV